MKIISGLVQGSHEWRHHRANHFNASDAPAMLGISPYKTRSQLLAERATGIIPDVDDATQRRFNDGHRFEALARPLAEEIIGDELSPVTGTEGKYSASFDGITFDGSVIFEHKTLNDSIRSTMKGTNIANVLPEYLCAQMEHQLIVSGAARCLFMATLWNGEEVLEETHGWYEPNMDMRYRILQGWEQFEKDLANYQHVEHVEKPKADAIMDLPALSVQATGMVTYSNLPEFKKAAEHYIANINTDLQTDQHFADAEATVKFCKATEEKLEVTKSAILAQTATIDEVIRTVSYIQEQLSKKRIMLNNLVSKEKEARKLAIVSKAGNDFSAYVEELEVETRPIRLNVQRPDFAGAIKGMKKLSAMQEEVDTALRNGKFAADQVAKDIRTKMLWIATNAEGMAFLFPDLQQIIAKPFDDFTLLIQSRIKEHKEAEARKEAEMRAKAEAESAARLEAERVRIQHEEEAKARAKVQSEAEQARTDGAEKHITQHDPVAESVAKNVVIIEHQDVISAYLASRDFGKEAGKVRAILVEFVKFKVQHEMVASEKATAE